MRDTNAYADSNSYAYTDSYAYGHAHRNALSDADVHARGSMGAGCTSAYCALWKQRSFRWYVLLFNRRL
jgi:gamma-glutamyl phosphate reductase